MARFTQINKKTLILIKLDLPNPHTTIRTSTYQPPLLQPKHGVDATLARIFDRNVLLLPFNAPHVYMRIERARCTMSGVWRPRNAIDPRGMEAPGRVYDLKECNGERQRK